MSAQPQWVSTDELELGASSAVHQSLRREVNERARERALPASGAPRDALELVCECAYPGCTGRLVVSVRDYETVRRFPTRFLVKAGHEVLESERVVADSEDYVVVEKTGSGGSDAIRTDPRRRVGRHVATEAS